MPSRTQHVDRGAPLALIVRQLGTAQKSNVGVSVYSRWVNRPSGRRIAAVAYKAGIAPNQLTATSAAFTAGGIILLALAHATSWLGVLVACLLTIGYMFDSADGQLARLLGDATFAGEWLDHVVDCVKLATLHGAVLIGWYRFFPLPSEALLLVPLAFAAESSVFFFSLILSEQLRRFATGNRSRQESDRTGISKLRAFAVLPAEYGIHCWIFVVWGAPTLFIPLYTVLAGLNVILLMAGLRRWFNEIRCLTPMSSK